MAGPRTSTGLLPVLLVVGAFFLFCGQFLDKAGEFWDDVTGQASEEYAVAPGARGRVEKCTADQVLKDKRCEDLKFVVIDAAKMPYIARNISLAWAEGHGFLLHRDTSESRTAKYQQTWRQERLRDPLPRGGLVRRVRVRLDG